MSSLYRAFPTGKDLGNIVIPEFKLPIGVEGQTLFCKEDGSVEYIPQYTCKFIDVATDSTELTSILTTKLSYTQAVDDWYKFSHLKQNNSGVYSTSYPSSSLDILKTNWVYTLSGLKYNNLSTTFTGVISNTFHTTYEINLSLSSTQSSSNTLVFVIAYIKESDKEYTLSVIRSGGNDIDTDLSTNPVTYGVVYNYKQDDSYLVKDLSAIDLDPIVGFVPAVWSEGGVTLKVVRDTTTVKIYTSLFKSDTLLDSSEIIIELDRDDFLKKFINASQYGFGTFKQDKAIFKCNSLTNARQIFIYKPTNLVYSYNYNTDIWDIDNSIEKSFKVANGYFIFSLYKKRFFYIYQNKLIQITQDIIPCIPYIPRSYLEPLKLIAYHDINRGDFVMVSNLGQAALADKITKKAVGIAMYSCLAGEELSIQTYGVFEDFNFGTITTALGETYFQGNYGKISLKDTPNTFKYPAAIAISPTSILIIPCVGYGTGSGTGPGPGPGTGPTIYIDNVKVRREETVLNGNAAELEEVLKAEDIFIELFGASNWSSQEYMLKQYFIIRNKDTIANLDIRLVSDTINIKELILPNNEIFFPIYKTDWKLSVQGSYEVKSIFEIISTALPSIIVDPSEAEAGWETQPIIDSNGDPKVIVLGQIKKFSSLNTIESLDEFTLALDLKQWVLDTIESEDYMIISTLSIANTSTENVVFIEIRSYNTVVSEFTLPIAQSIVLDVHREDISIYCKGNVKVVFDAQVTAYKFKV